MARGNVLYYEDIDLGDEIGPVEKSITDEMVESFCEVWGSGRGPSRFTSEEIAKRDRLPGPIVPGTMSMALMAQLLTDWSPGVILKHLDVVFRQPVLHQPVTLTAVITDKREEDGENLVECDVTLSTEDRGRLVGGKAILALPNRPS